MSKTSEPTQELVSQINQAHGLRFVLRERCQDGFEGAWLLSDGDGQRAILKLTTDFAPRRGKLPQLIDRARAAGYPTPRWLAVGETVDGTAYHIVDFVSGEPMSRSPLNLRVVEHLIDMVERQAGLIPIRPGIGPVVSGRGIGPVMSGTARSVTARTLPGR